LIFAGSKHRKDRFFKENKAFTMLKHGFAALMIFHDAETPLGSTVHFSDAETPRCSTVHFSDAETPLKNTGDCFPNAETPLIGTFHFFSVTETSHPPIILTPETTPSSTCFALSSPPSAATPFAATFPVAETPIVSNFPSVSPMLKHHCSVFFIPFHHLFHPPSSTKQFRPAIVSPLFVLKHHCSVFLIPFPSSFSPPSSTKQFRPAIVSPLC
jgi:hypothetical protein